MIERKTFRRPKEPVQPAAPGMQMQMQPAAGMRTEMSARQFGDPYEDSTQTALPSPLTHEEIDDGSGHNIGCYRAKQHPGAE